MFIVNKIWQVIAIEIETGKSDVETNIQKCVDNGLKDIRVVFRHFSYHKNYRLPPVAQDSWHQTSSRASPELYRLNRISHRIPQKNLGSKEFGVNLPAEYN